MKYLKVWPLCLNFRLITARFSGDQKFRNFTVNKGCISFINSQYHKVPKFSDTRKLCCYHPKTEKKRFYYRVMDPKDADSIANSEDS